MINEGWTTSLHSFYSLKSNYLNFLLLSKENKYKIVKKINIIIQIYLIIFLIISLEFYFTLVSLCLLFLLFNFSNIIWLLKELFNEFMSLAYKK